MRSHSALGELAEQTYDNINIGRIWNHKLAPCQRIIVEPWLAPEPPFCFAGFCRFKGTALSTSFVSSVEGGHVGQGFLPYNGPNSK